MKEHYKKLLSLALIAVIFSLVFSFTGDTSRTTYRSRGLYPPAVNFNATWPGIQTFTSSGTWYRPPGVERVLVIIAGPGGGGGGFGGLSDGSNGGSGGACKTEEVDVRGTTSEVVTIGTGGAGGGEDADGSDGSGASSFGALVTAAPGLRGDTNGTTANSISRAVFTQGSGHAGGAAANGHPGAYGLGGTGGGGVNGSGGGGSYGAGGDGGVGAGGAVGTYGGGGGGASQAAGNGGAGGDGICIVIPILYNVSILP